MSSPIEKDSDKIVKVLSQYVKHKNLEIELTLKDGRRILLERDRELKNDKIIVGTDSPMPHEILVREIRKAEVYAL